MKPVAGTKYFSDTREKVLDFIPAGSEYVLDVDCGEFDQMLKAGHSQ